MRHSGIMNMKYLASRFAGTNKNDIKNLIMQNIFYSYFERLPASKVTSLQPNHVQSHLTH